MTRGRVLSLSVATGRVGYVYFDDGQPAHWGMSHKAARSPLLAAEQTKKWLSLFAPDVIVTERVGVHSRKGALTKYLIAAVADVAGESDWTNFSVPRVQSYANKYEEADALAARFPILSAWVPSRPRIWEAEPRNMILFEAVSLALNLVDEPGPPTDRRGQR